MHHADDTMEDSKFLVMVVVIDVVATAGKGAGEGGRVGLGSSVENPRR